MGVRPLEIGQSGKEIYLLSIITAHEDRSLSGATREESHILVGKDEGEFAHRSRPFLAVYRIVMEYLHGSKPTLLDAPAHF